MKPKGGEISPAASSNTCVLIRSGGCRGKQYYFFKTSPSPNCTLGTQGAKSDFLFSCKTVEDGGSKGANRALAVGSRVRRTCGALISTAHSLRLEPGSCRGMATVATRRQDCSSLGGEYPISHHVIPSSANFRSRSSLKPIQPSPLNSLSTLRLIPPSPVLSRIPPLLLAENPVSSTSQDPSSPSVTSP